MAAIKKMFYLKRTAYVLSMILLVSCASKLDSRNSSGTIAKVNSSEKSATSASSDASGLSKDRPSTDSLKSSEDDIDALGTSTDLPAGASELVVPKQDASMTDVSALGMAIKSQDFEKINQAASQVLSQSPFDVRALNAMAMYQYKKENLEAASYLLKRSITKNPNSAESYSNLGLVELGQGEKRKAIINFRKALSLNANLSSAAVNIGTILAQEKDYGKAIHAFEIAIGQGVKSLGVLNNYGTSLMAVGRFEKAREIYKMGLNENNNKELYHNYAILLIDHLQEYKEGLDIIGKLKFFGLSSESRNKINALENKAKAGLK